MQSRGSFIGIWMVATVPVLVGAEMLVDPYLEEIRVRSLGYMLPILPFYAGVSLLLGLFQARALAVSRTEVPNWDRWVVAGYVCAAIVMIGLEAGMERVRAFAGSARMPAAWFWLFSGLATFSCTLCLAAGEALALWGRRDFRSLCLWIGIRVAVALGLCGVVLAAGLYPYALLGLPYDLPRYRFVVGATVHALSALLVAWMLDRFYFSRGA